MRSPPTRQKAQKAHEARAALANIAAAAAASHHEHDAPAVPVAAPAVQQDTDASDAATLTLGGEAIELPRGHRSESTGFAETSNADQAAALADLTQALDQLASPGQEQQAAERVTRPATTAHAHAGDGATAAHAAPRAGPTWRWRPPSRRPQPRARCSTAVPRWTFRRPPRRPSASEPIILGVGVPASEL